MYEPFVSERAIFDLFLPVFENPVHEKTCFGVIDKELTESVFFVATCGERLHRCG